MSEKKEYRYFYNIEILAKLSSSTVPIIAYLQPQMLPKNFNSLSEKDKIIYNKHKTSNPNYFEGKQEFYNRISYNIEKYKNLNSKYFTFYDLSELLSVNEKNEQFFFDHVHYTHASREIISERIFKDLQKILSKN
jgi:hypothetical protein